MPITSITRVAATPARTLRRGVIRGGGTMSPDDDGDPASVTGTGSNAPTMTWGRIGRPIGDDGGDGDGIGEPGGGKGIRPTDGGAGGWSGRSPTGCTSTGSRKMTSSCLTNAVGRPKTYRRKS